MGHHDQVYNQPQPQDHKSSWTHELISGAAAFEAMKAYENNKGVAGNGDHKFAREMLAAVAAAEVDKLVETKGLDYIDKERAKQNAVQQAHQMYDEKYAGGGGGGGGGLGGRNQGGQQAGYNQGGYNQGGYNQGGGGGGGGQGYGAGGGSQGGQGGGGFDKGERHHHEGEREREREWERAREQGRGNY